MTDMPRTFVRSERKRVDLAKLERLWPSRLPDRQLAKEMGHDIRVLRRRATALGLRPRRAIWAAPLDATS